MKARSVASDSPVTAPPVTAETCPECGSLDVRAFEPRWFQSIGIFMVLALAALVPLFLRTRHWAVVDERLTYREAMSASAAAHGAVSLWLLAALSAVFVAAGLFLLIATDATLIGLLCVVFFGGCLGVFVWMLVMRRRG